MFGADRADIQPGGVVAVIGAGPVGLMATMCAQLFGPARVLVGDMVESRLEIAQQLGGTPINAPSPHPVEAIAGYTAGIGAASSIQPFAPPPTPPPPNHSAPERGTT